MRRGSSIALESVCLNKISSKPFKFDAFKNEGWI